MRSDKLDRGETKGAMNCSVVLWPGPVFSPLSSSYCSEPSRPPVLKKVLAVDMSWKAVRSHSAAFCRPGPEASLVHGLTVSANLRARNDVSWNMISSSSSMGDGQVGSASARPARPRASTSDAGDDDRMMAERERERERDSDCDDDDQRRRLASKSERGERTLRREANAPP